CHHTAPNLYNDLSLHDALPILKKFYANADGNPKIFILTDSWDVFDVTNITNNQVLWEGDRIGYVFVDGRLVKDFFYIVNHKEKRSEEHTSKLQSRFDIVWRLLL